MNYNKIFPWLAEIDGKIIGDAALLMRKTGWNSHLGNVIVVVAREFLNQDRGTLLFNKIVELAGEMGLEKLFSKIYFKSPAAPQAFTQAAFDVKAVLEDLIKDH